MSSPDKEIEVELSAHISGINAVEGTPEQTIEAINSVPSIRNKEKIIAGLPDSARFVKGYPVLTEGTYNGVYYPDSVLQEAAPLWKPEYHDKPGMTRKGKLNHKSGVEGRVTHILDSYYDDKYIKQDFLILDKKAIELWDNGFLDDPSIASRLTIDMKNSTPSEVRVKKITKGLGTDFVDRPACKTCGLDTILAELESRDKNEVEANLEDEIMSENEDTNKILSMFAELGDLIKSKFGKEDEVVENESEEEQTDLEETQETEETQELENQDESEESEEELETEETEEENEDSEEENEEELETSEEDETMTDKDFETKLSELEQSYDARLSAIEGKFKDRVEELENQLKAEEQDKAAKIHADLSEKVIELSEKFDIEVKEDEVKELSEEQLKAKVETFTAVLEKVPEGKLPNLLDTSLEEQKEEQEQELEEIIKKRDELYQG